MDTCHTETVTHDSRTYTLRLVYDQDTDSPLDNDEGAVKISYRKGCRYLLGNDPRDEEGDKEIRLRIDALDDPSINLKRALEGGEVLEPLVGLPVYTYMHSGTAMRTTPFHCRWDSGRSGWVYIEKKTVLDWMGGKRVTHRKIEQAKKSLAAIVEEFGRWVNGECYIVFIEDEDGEVLDSCGGYIGMEYAIDEGKGMAKRAHEAYLREQAERQHWNERGVVTASA